MTAYSEWRRALPDADPHGLHGSRISSIFEWTTLKTRIESLFRSRSVSLEAVGLDLDELKAARDSVAHSGMLPDSLGSAPERALGTLLRAQLAVQVLLLREVGYRGRLVTRVDPWQRSPEMKEFLRTEE